MLGEILYANFQFIETENQIVQPVFSEHIRTYLLSKESKMFDIGNQKVDVSCNCGRRHSATLKDVSNGKSIRCGCGVTIKLSDSGGSVRKGLSDINKSMSDFEKALKKLGQ